MRRFTDTLTIAALAGLIVGGSLLATAPAMSDDTRSTAPTDKAAVEQIIQDYIKKHPEVVVDAIEAWRAKQRLAEEERAKQALVSQRDRIYNSAFSPIAGNPDGDVTVVEFFDYQCGYCKRVFGSFVKTVKQDGNVRVVFKEFPILGPASRFAAEAALASKMQGKYFEFHRALMELKTGLNPHSVLAVAKSSGLDVDRLQEDMKSSPVQDEIKRNFELAENLGIRGTPAFVIGDQLVPGAINAATMKTMIAEARGKS